jgi:uncharacterized protein (TIGR02246 family)
MARLENVVGCWAVTTALVAACGRPTPALPAPATSLESARGGAMAVLTHGAAAWNRGDLAAFMSDYAPDASFVTPRLVLHGRDVIGGRYAPRFAAGAVRDSLSFEDLEVDLLAPDALNAIAYYVLQHGDSVVARGPTSLVMRKMGGRWYITHDHST